MDRRDPVSVETYRHALFEIDADLAFAFGAGLGIERQNKQIFRWRLFRIFENAALMAHMPYVAIAAENFLRCCRDRNISFFGVGNRILPRVNIPFAPRRDDFQMWRESFVSQLEPDLIVALARAPMSDGIGAQFHRHFNLALCQQRTGDGCAKQVFALIHGA